MTTNYPYFEPYGDPYYGYAPPQPAGPPLPPPAPQPPRRRLRRGVLGAGVAALAAAAVLVGVTVAEQGSATITGSGSTAQLLPTTPGSGQLPGSGGPGSRSGTSTSVALASAQQKQGIVTIVSVLKYQNAESAGTGMILTSDGEVLTNNHVIDGATSITVTVASTGRSYRADVVGTDPSDDVAVLDLRNASGLATAKIGGSSGVAVGDKIVGVGNAGGTGTLRASSGTVTALNQTITATDDQGQDGERLTGLIEVDAPIISGDSGGPLYDSAGQIVGMNTAASANRAANDAAYAIPIDTAVKIAGQIETGVETSKIHIGLPAFLGVSVENSSQGAVVVQLLPGAAAGAGITQGSVITSVDGTRVSSAATLKSALGKFRPGQKATIGWTSLDGSTHSATVTLGTGPAD